MGACGIAFGEIAVSGYFWRCVAPMDNPLDYVARLSLTFEQANLDFARHFARDFAAVGDEPSAQLLERIYRDEIGHVAYGLKWFRRWKQPGESDWDAFCRQLRFPLSPRRAKGFQFNAAGRSAAGLDEDFIARLDVFARSKGRTPVVFLFNPLAEGFIERGRAFTPVKHQRRLAADLANLPQFLCREDDIVLVPRLPSVAFLRSIKDAGLPLPEFVECASGRPVDLGVTGLSGRRIGRLRPWAWSPESVEMLAPLFPHVTGETPSGAGLFNPAIAALFSKTWSAAFFRRFLASRDPGDASWLCREEQVGISAASTGEVLAAVAEIRARGHHRVVVKEALGLAGHNAIRLLEPAVLDAQRRWIERAVDGGRTVVVEPWLDRVCDFSMQLEKSDRGLRLCGFTGLVNDANGQFIANRAAPDFARRIPADVARALGGPADIAARLRRCFDELRVMLAPELEAAGFRGPVGVDAFVYRDAHGVARLKAVLEINPRYTMGRVLVELMAHVAPGYSASFTLHPLADARAAGCADFTAYAGMLRERDPLARAGEPVPRICAGALVLNDPAQAEACLAVLRVGAPGSLSCP
jgi:hypothetical protein